METWSQYFKRQFKRLKNVSPLKLVWFMLVFIMVLVTFVAPVLTIILQDERFNFGL